MKLNALQPFRLISATTFLALATVLPARADYSSTVLSFNPSAYWRLNELAPVPGADVATNRGTAGAALTGFYRGTAGVNFIHPTLPGALADTDGAVTFSGNPPGGVAALGYLMVPHAAVLNPSVFTAEAWLNPTDLDGTIAAPNHCAFSCGDFASPRAGWLIYQSGEGWNLRMYNQNGTAVSLNISGGGPPVAGAWYHVAVVFDGTTARLYINGAQVASGNPTSYVPGTAGALSIGVRADNAFPWNGVADEVAFYTNVLSAGLIAAHYSAATTNGPGYATQILLDHPVAYYRLNEPTYTPPDPGTLPVAANVGTLSTAANGTYEPGAQTGIGGPPYGGFGVGNTAAAFDGFNGYVFVGNPTDLNFTNQITVMAWVKPTMTDGLRNILAHGYITSPACEEIFFRINAGTYQFGSCESGESVSVGGLANQDVGNWTFLVGTYDGANWNLYHNSALVGSAPGTVGAGLVDSPWSIGSRGDPTLGDGRFFGGSIDEVAIFTNALSAAQIQQILYAANVSPIIVQQPQAPAGTILAGAPVSISVVAVGNPALAYQWTKAGTNIPGQTTTILAFSNITTNDAGNYAVIVTNSYGATTSSVVALSVSYPALPAALAYAAGYPAYNSATHAASLTQVILEFTGPLGAEGSNPIHYSIPGLSVSGARFTNLNQTVVLTTSAQTQGANYAVTVTGVTDGVGRPLANNTAQFRAWVASPLNGLRFEFYPSEATANPAFLYTDVGALTNNSLFPDHPVMETNLWAFDSRIIFPDDTHDSYGARMRGVFVPPSSGYWRFYLRSDDSSQVFLNPNGPDAAGKQLISQQPGCCDDWNLHVSAAFPLVVGQGYYLEMLYKEGGGGDYGKVAALLEPVPGVTNFPPLGTPNTAIDPASIAGPAIGYPYAPADVGGALALVGPNSVTVEANHTTAFSVAVSSPGGWPISYQWRRNGSDILGATGSTYTLVPTSADNNAHFTVLVSKLGASVLSAQATLTVTGATDPPAVVAVHGSTGLNTLIVSFNELLAAPATSSFSVAGFTTLAAVLDSTGTNVILTFDRPLSAGQTYILSIQNVQDSSGNTLVSTTAPARTFVFSRGLMRFDFFGGLSQSVNTITELTLDPRYPNSPDWTAFIAGFDTRSIFPDDSHTGYGDHITGLFVAPGSTNYVFYLRSDDTSQFFINPVGSDPAGSTWQMEEATCCHGFSVTPSAALPLTNGQWYYVETTHKEGNGGDYVQVAVQEDQNPANPDLLLPIPSSMVGVLADPVGASVTITQQPPNAVGVYLGTPLNASFDASDGGFMTVNYGAPPGPWSYNAAAGTWTNFGPSGCGGPFGSGLRSPVLTIRSNDPVVLTFAHRWSFEADASASYDGGQVRLSVNGGPFATVPGANFSGNGYNGTIGGSILGAITGTPGWLDEAFVTNSPGYADHTFLTSVATLGSFNPGDRIQLEFLASWDECSEGTEPNWEIDSVRVTGGDAVLPADVFLTVGAESTYQNLPNPYLSYFWQRDNGAGFTDIAGANSATYELYAGLADSGTHFRCIVYGPGASATSGVATVTVTVPLYVTRTGPATLNMAWPLPPPPLPAATTFLLEHSPTMAPGSWITVPSGSYVVGSTTVSTSVTIQAGQNQYYRLRRN